MYPLDDTIAAAATAAAVAIQLEHWMCPVSRKDIVFFVSYRVNVLVGSSLSPTTTVQIKNHTFLMLS